MIAKLFELSLRAFPESFRAKYGDEMVAVFNDRARDLSLFQTLREIAGVSLAGARLRIEAGHLPSSSLAAMLTVAMVATALALYDARQPVSNTAQRIEFSAHDPAGFFTLSIANGRPVGATLNRVPLSSNRIVSEKDSIKILAADGAVALAVAFDAERSQISWTPRQSSSR